MYNEPGQKTVKNKFHELAPNIIRRNVNLPNQLYQNIQTNENSPKVFICSKVNEQSYQTKIANNGNTNTTISSVIESHQNNNSVSIIVESDDEF
ncbi:hypothetical protein A3Q56_07648 [Intoshia linei]|uniref:Uncharacterized protein n=1 Tax=Intoshia linei TaxID=1819745 RepID=A0A177ARL6_9BILA|nr:hypothetical protein A3Q56_07648 [Intoshia linei]